MASLLVVGAKGKFHGVDPKIEVDEFDLWTLWIWEGRPLYSYLGILVSGFGQLSFHLTHQYLSSSILFRLVDPFLSDMT